MTPNKILAYWSENSRQTRIAVELTQAELARHAGVSLGLVKRFEAGKAISLHSLLRIAIAFGRSDTLLDFLRPPQVIPGLGVTRENLANMTIDQLEASAKKAAKKPRQRVRHKGKAK